MAGEKARIVIFGGTGYLGKFMVRASVSSGHPTYAYVRPVSPDSGASKLDLLKEFEKMGVTIIQGELSEQGKLVSTMKEVDVVISALAVPQHLDQLKIIDAIKEAGNITRFVPSEYGNEVERVRGLPPFQVLLDNKKTIRRATQAAGIPYTFVSANSLTAYFVEYLLHPSENHQQVSIYGTGEAKAVLNYEEDVAAYTVKSAVDSRTLNHVLIVRPPKNVVSQLDLVSSWEHKTGRKIKRNHISEQDLINMSQALPFPENIPPAILHNIFVAGAQLSFKLGENDLEASKLYPDYKYTTVDDYLNLCVIDPPKPKLAAFA